MLVSSVGIFARSYSSHGTTPNLGPVGGGRTTYGSQHSQATRQARRAWSFHVSNRWMKSTRVTVYVCGQEIVTLKI